MCLLDYVLVAIARMRTGALFCKKVFSVDTGSLHATRNSGPNVKLIIIVTIDLYFLQRAISWSHVLLLYLIYTQ